MKTARLLWLALLFIGVGMAVSPAWAKDEGQVRITEGGQSRTVAVPVEMPEGVSYEGVFGARGRVPRMSFYGGMGGAGFGGRPARAFGPKAAGPLFNRVPLRAYPRTPHPRPLSPQAGRGEPLFG